METQELIAVEQELKGVQDEIAREIPRKITNDLELKTCSNMLRWVKTKAKALNEQRLSLTRPIDDSKKRIMQMFAEPLDALNAMEIRIKGVILDYEEAVAEKRRAEQAEENARARAMELAQKKQLIAAAEKAIGSGDDELAEKYLANAETLEVAPINVAAAKRSGVSTRKVHKWKVIDEAKIPDQFWILDEKAINALVKAQGEKCKIEGIEVFEETILSARTF